MKSNSNITLVILLFFLLLGCENNRTPIEVIDEFGTWTKVKSGVSVRLYDIDFVDTQNGWVVGDSGVILHSENGGESWERQTCPISESLFAVDFVDTSNGWICSFYSILKTTDGGKNWTLAYFENLGEGRFRNIQFIDKNIGFCVGGRGSFGSTGVLLQTEDGKTWQESFSDSVPTLTHISVLDEDKVWVCGFGGTILSTTDVGITWTKNNLNISPRPALTTIQFVDRNYGWVGSRDDWLGFYLTATGGDTWIRISEESFQIICGVLSLCFVNKETGWMGNFPFGRILKTTDGGLTWQYDSEIIQRVNSFHFFGTKVGWAVGNYGGILKYTVINDHD